MVKASQSIKYKKAPQAPRRFKSAYMFFSTEKHRLIRSEMGEKLQTTEVAKMVSQAWKNLPADEREKWDEMARRDKARYEVEKTMYTGPWKVPAKKRTQKDPSAPKRPMSAFLSFSNSKRAAVKAQNPDIGNAEVSRILAKMWKEAPEGERKQHIEREFGLRQEYKSAIAEWRKNAGKELDDLRKKREEMAMRTVDAGDGSAVSVSGATIGNSPVAGGLQHCQRMDFPSHHSHPQQHQDCENHTDFAKQQHVANAPTSAMNEAAGGNAGHSARVGLPPPLSYPPGPPHGGHHPHYGGPMMYRPPPHYGTYGAGGPYDESAAGPDGVSPYPTMAGPPGAYPGSQDAYAMQGHYSQGYNHPPPESYGSAESCDPNMQQYYDYSAYYHAPPEAWAGSAPSYYGAPLPRNAAAVGGSTGGPPPQGGSAYSYGSY